MGKTRKQILTDPILKKSHTHKEKDRVPKVCPKCRGTGASGILGGGNTPEACSKCRGLGEVYE
jgi:DnaJ-class molecular chaperone